MALLECRLGGVQYGDLWTFRDLDFSRVVHSRPMIGPFATRYFRTFLTLVGSLPR